MIIEELSGRKRVLVLRGGGLPKHGAGFPAKMRVVTKFLPGAGEATQQVLGPEEGSPTWEGSWSTPVLASLPSYLREGASGPIQNVARAKTLVEILDSIRGAGSRIRLTWAQDDDHHITREGRITEFEPTFRTKDDVEWKVEWAWAGRGEPRSRVLNLKKDNQLAQHKKIEAELNKLTGELTASKILSSNKGILGSASHFSLGDVEAFVDGIKGITGGFAREIERLGSQIKQIGDLAQSIEDLPADIAQQFVDAAASVMSSCAAFKDAVTRKGPEAYARFDQSASVKTIVNASNYLSGAAAQADAVASACADARAALLAKSGAKPGSAGGQGAPQPAIAAVVFARQGDTFASIARAKIGDSSLGPAVARASGYPAFELSPRVGDVVIVPSLAAAKKLMAGG